MNNKISNEKIASAAKWSALAEVAARIASPLINIILVRLLAPEAFGIVASITIVTSFADIFSDAGFQKYIIQHEYKDQLELNKASSVAFSANIVLAAVVYMLILFFREDLATLVGCPGEGLAITISSLAVFCTAFPSVSTARFRRDLNFKPLFRIRIGSSLIPIIVTIPLALILHSYWALIIGTLAQKLFIAVATIVQLKWKPYLLFDVFLFRQMLSFSVWNLLETLSIWFAGQANIFIVANILDSYYLGLYKTAMSVVNSCLGLITASFTPVFFSVLSRYQDNKIKYLEAFNSFQYVLAIFVLPLGVGMFVFRDLLLNILLGSQWSEATIFMGLWSFVSAFIIVFSNTASEVYRSYGRPKISLILQLCYLVIYIPVIYISAKGGFEPLSYTSCFIRFVPMLADILVLHILFGIKYRDIAGNSFYAICASAVSGLVGVLLLKCFTGLAWTLCSVLICILIYFLIIIISPKQRERLTKLRVILSK